MSFVDSGDGFINRDKIVRVFWTDEGRVEEWTVEYFDGEKLRTATTSCHLLRTLGFVVTESDIDYPLP